MSHAFKMTAVIVFTLLGLLTVMVWYGVSPFSVQAWCGAVVGCIGGAAAVLWFTSGWGGQFPRPPK